MFELISINSNKTVNARNLYKFLELASGQFARWAKSNIVENKFAEQEVDYEGVDTVVEGNNVIDYELSIEFAKKLCMVSHTKRGEQARQYFIECEKRLKAVNAPHDSYMISDPVERALKWIEEEKVRQDQAKQLLEQKPKVEFFDAVAESKDAIEIASVAKVLNVPGVGRNKLFEFLRNHKILMRNNQPYQKYVDAGYFRIIEQKYERPNGDTCINIKTLVYQNGVRYIHELLKSAHM